METRWGHPSSQRRRPRRSIRQSSTITTCSYFQSMRKDRFRPIYGLRYRQQSTIYSPKRKQETKFYRDLEYSSHRPYTEGHGQKKNHPFDSARFIKSFRQHWSWSIALQDLRYGRMIGYIKLVQELCCQAALELFLLDLRCLTTLPITHGVPKGAILSPFLFCCYLNDLPNAPQECCLES